MQTTRAPERLWHRGMLVDVVLDGAGTGGAFAVLDVRAGAGAGTPRVLHEREDQCLLVLEGAVDVVVGGEARRLGPGRCAELPRDVPHGFTAAAGGARFLLTCVPAGFEAFVRAAGAGDAADAPDEDDLVALRAVAGLRELP
jgi:quercetin dioxygenase-like cupin family protein